MGGVNKTQEFLEGLSPKPLPPELREKILSTVYQRQRQFLVISPALRMLFAVSCVLAVLAFFCDIMIKNSENDFLGSIMNGSQISEMILDKDLQEITKELFKIEYDKRLNQWLVRHYKVKKKEAKLTSYQNIMDILKE
jgi:hypothetical protein